jgi:L-arabinose isomerase
MRIGLFSIGLDTYWAQFDGLLNNLNGYHAHIRNRIGAMDVEVVDAGMVDNVQKAS